MARGSNGEDEGEARNLARRGGLALWASEGAEAEAGESDGARAEEKETAAREGEKERSQLGGFGSWEGERGIERRKRQGGKARKIPRTPRSHIVVE